MSIKKDDGEIKSFKTLLWSDLWGASWKHGWNMNNKGVSKSAWKLSDASVFSFLINSLRRWLNEHTSSLVTSMLMWKGWCKLCKVLCQKCLWKNKENTLFVLFLNLNTSYSGWCSLFFPCRWWDFFKHDTIKTGPSHETWNLLHICQVSLVVIHVWVSVCVFICVTL